jgi:hypothetical protein
MDRRRDMTKVILASRSFEKSQERKTQKTGKDRSILIPKMKY